jgi:hypothetical protein
MRRPDEGPGRYTSGPGELVERDRADVIVTTDLDPLIVTAVPGEDQEALARRRYLLVDAQPPRLASGLCLKLAGLTT